MPYLTLHGQADDKSCLNCMHTIQREQTAGRKSPSRRNFQICFIFCNSSVTFSDAKVLYTHWCLLHLSLSRAFSPLISKTMLHSMFAEQQSRGWKTYIHKQQKLKFPWDTKPLWTMQKLNKVIRRLNWLLLCTLIPQLFVFPGTAVNSKKPNKLILTWNVRDHDQDQECIVVKWKIVLVR